MRDVWEERLKPVCVCELKDTKWKILGFLWKVKTKLAIQNCQY